MARKKSDSEKKSYAKLPKGQNPNGRPCELTQEMSDLICKRIATSTLGITALCKKYPDLPSKNAIFEWRWLDSKFNDQYTKAKFKQAELLAEDILDISDHCKDDLDEDEYGNEKPNHEVIQRSRLKVDTRKWIASKLLPKLYGDKISLEHKTAENESLKQELADLRAKLDAQNKKDY